MTNTLSFYAFITNGPSINYEVNIVRNIVFNRFCNISIYLFIYNVSPNNTAHF